MKRIGFFRFLVSRFALFGILIMGAYITYNVLSGHRDVLLYALTFPIFGALMGADPYW